MGKPDFFIKTYGKYFDKLPDLAAYLNRIGLAGEEIPLTKEGLDRLQQAHLRSVPFENLDIFDYGLKVDFGVGELFEKVVTRRRGGYCFELNAIYMTLLEAAGFEVHPVGVRIMSSAVGFTPAIAHRAAIVTIGGKRYYTDVGFGTWNAPSASICIDDYDAQDVGSDIYSVEGRPYNNKAIMRRTEDGISTLFMFSPDPFNIPDFVTYNTAMQLRGFRQKRIAILHTPSGSISVDGGVFRRRENNEIIETPLPTAEDAFKVLTEEFGMLLTEPLLAAASIT